MYIKYDMLGPGFRESVRSLTHQYDKATVQWLIMCAIRLHVERWMLRYLLGYLLHLSIPRGPNMRIIDTETRNAEGEWLAR